MPPSLPRLVLKQGADGKPTYLKSKASTWDEFLQEVAAKLGMSQVTTVESDNGIALGDLDELEDFDKDDIIVCFDTSINASTTSSPATPPAQAQAQAPASSLTEPRLPPGRRRTTGSMSPARGRAEGQGEDARKLRAARRERNRGRRQTLQDMLNATPGKSRSPSPARHRPPTSLGIPEDRVLHQMNVDELAKLISTISGQPKILFEGMTPENMRTACIQHRDQPDVYAEPGRVLTQARGLVGARGNIEVDPVGLKKRLAEEERMAMENRIQRFAEKNALVVKGKVGKMAALFDQGSNAADVLDEEARKAREMAMDQASMERRHEDEMHRIKLEHAREMSEKDKQNREMIKRLEKLLREALLRQGQVVTPEDKRACNEEIENISRRLMLMQAPDIDQDALSKLDSEYEAMQSRWQGRDFSAKSVNASGVQSAPADGQGQGQSESARQNGDGDGGQGNRAINVDEQRMGDEAEVVAAATAAAADAEAAAAAAADAEAEAQRRRQEVEEAARAREREAMAEAEAMRLREEAARSELEERQREEARVRELEERRKQLRREESLKQMQAHKEKLKRQKEQEAREEAARLEAEALAARLQAEREEAARVEAQRAEAERLEAEVRRLQVEKAEAARLHAEKVTRQEMERIEKLRKEAEREEAARLDALRAEVAKLKAEKEEMARLRRVREEEQRKQQEKEAAELAEQQSIQQERLEAEWLQKEAAERAEQQRQEQEKLEAERSQKEADEHADQQRLQQEMIRRQETERLEKERLGREEEARRLEKERVDKEEARRVEAQKAELARLQSLIRSDEESTDVAQTNGSNGATRVDEAAVEAERAAKAAEAQDAETLKEQMRARMEAEVNARVQAAMAARMASPAKSDISLRSAEASSFTGRNLAADMSQASLADTSSLTDADDGRRVSIDLATGSAQEEGVTLRQTYTYGQLAKHGIIRSSDIPSQMTAVTTLTFETSNGLDYRLKVHINEKPYRNSVRFTYPSMKEALQKKLNSYEVHGMVLTVTKLLSLVERKFLKKIRAQQIDQKTQRPEDRGDKGSEKYDGGSAVTEDPEGQWEHVLQREALSLVDMGFSKDVAIETLRETMGDVSAALELLLSRGVPNVEDPDLETHAPSDATTPDPPPSADPELSSMEPALRPAAPLNHSSHTPVTPAGPPTTHRTPELSPRSHLPATTHVTSNPSPSPFSTVITARGGPDPRRGPVGTPSKVVPNEDAMIVMGERVELQKREELSVRTLGLLSQVGASNLQQNFSSIDNNHASISARGTKSPMTPERKLSKRPSLWGRRKSGNGK